MQFYSGYKNRPTCRGEGPIKIRFRHLPDKKSQFNSHYNKNNFKYLIDDSGSGYIYHYDNFFEWKEGKRGCEKLTGISPRIIGQYYKDGSIFWKIRVEEGQGQVKNFYANAPDDWDNAVWILPNNNVEGPFLYSKHNENKKED